MAMAPDLLSKWVEFGAVWSHFQGCFHDPSGIREAILIEQ